MMIPTIGRFIDGSIARARVRDNERPASVDSEVVQLSPQHRSTVVELAIRRRADIVTGDTQDLSRLASAARARLRIIEI